MKRLFLLVLLPAALLFVVVALFVTGGEARSAPTVRVTRGDVVRHAVASGRVQPAFEVPVKSRNGGVLTQRFVRLGERVEVGQPLVEVRPMLTEGDMLAAERSLLAATEAEENVDEFRRGTNLLGRSMLFLQGTKNVERMRLGAARARVDAEEQLQLLQEGRAEIDGKVIDFVIRAPVAGNVIELRGEPGEPVVPSSNFGSGTELLILADLTHPVFRGTIDEIDVGRLRTGMQVALEVGALPGVEVQGELTEIALRSQVVNNATVFGVKIAVTPPAGAVLRSGYSAVARIEIERAADVLVLPERVVDYRAGRAFVLVPGPDDEPVEREIECGVSDSLTVEITGGLDEGDLVLERVF